MGYKKTYTYDLDIKEYFYKDENWQNLPEADFDTKMYVLDDKIVDAPSFIEELNSKPAIYIKALKEDGTPVGRAEGFDPRVKITTIEEYFSWIKNLGQVDRKYTILPLDEEPFAINANTRAISIPAEFKKNGIAVQGDEIAEIVYFKVDRYFDYMDFNNTDIYIQWEAPKDANGETVKGVSREYVRDIESEPGKLIFGWAISSALTKVPGPLKFAVRFFQWDDEAVKSKLAYSFSTLTASINVQTALNFDLTESTLQIDDVGDRIIDRLENSTVIGGYVAQPPEWITDLNPEADLVKETGTLKLYVQAKAKDSGEIAYEWTKQEILQDPTKTGQLTHETGVYEFIELPQDEWPTMSPEYNYYYKNGDNYLRYGSKEGQPIPATPDIWEHAIYEKKATFIADSVGIYRAKAINRVGSTFERVDSTPCVIPRPLPVFDIINPDDKVIITDTTVGTISAGAGNSDGELSYVWHYNPNKNLNLSGGTGEWEIVTNANKASLTVNQEGHYKATVINTRNKEIEEAETALSRVTYPATDPEFTKLSEKEREYDELALADDNCPTVTIDETKNVFSDWYTVQWFKQTDDTHRYPVSEAMENVFSFNPAKIPDNVFEENKDASKIFGKYVAVITNNVNGSTASVDSDFYLIT